MNKRGTRALALNIHNNFLSKSKRSQTTIFIIIAIIIVAVVILFFTLASPNLGGISPNIEPVYNSFTSCLEETSKEGIYYIAAHGGYYEVPFESSIVYFSEEIPYYYLNSRNYIPTLEVIEEELGKYVYDNLKECFNVEDFKKQGFSIKQDYSISTNINKGNVKIKSRGYLTISKGEDTSQFKDIEVKLDYNLKNLHDVSKEIIDTYSEKPGSICLTCLDEISKENNVNIKATPVTDVSIFENDIIWFSIDNKDDLSEEKLTLVFVVEQ